MPIAQPIYHQAEKKSAVKLDNISLIVQLFNCLVEGDRIFDDQSILLSGAKEC